MTTSTFRETYQPDNIRGDYSEFEIEFRITEGLLFRGCYAYVQPDKQNPEMIGSAGWQRNRPCEIWLFSGKLDHQRGAFKATAAIAAKLVEMATQAHSKGLPPVLVAAQPGEMLEVEDALLIQGHLWPISRVTATRATTAAGTSVQRRLSGWRDGGSTRTSNDSCTTYPAYKKADNPDLEAYLCHPQ